MLRIFTAMFYVGEIRKYRIQLVLKVYGLQKAAVQNIIGRPYFSLFFHICEKNITNHFSYFYNHGIFISQKSFIL